MAENLDPTKTALYKKWIEKQNVKTFSTETLGEEIANVLTEKKEFEEVPDENRFSPLFLDALITHYDNNEKKHESEPYRMILEYQKDNN